MLRVPGKVRKRSLTDRVDPKHDGPRCEASHGRFERTHHDDQDKEDNNSDDDDYDDEWMSAFLF